MSPRKALSAVAVAAVLIAAGSASAAPIFPVFTVDSSVLGAGAGTINPFVANDIGGPYNETITFTSATTFDVSIQFSAGNFILDDTNGNTTLNAAQTGLGSTYGLYALFTGSGTVSTSGTTATFDLNPGGALDVFLDPNNDTTFAQPATGATAYATTNGGEDVLLASGVAITGQGTEGINAPNLTGAFGQSTTFTLTPSGSTFFIAPVPFYSISLQSGQFESFPLSASGTQRLTGTLNANFTSVPEPSVITLMGIALLGLGFVTRRSKRS